MRTTHLHLLLMMLLDGRIYTIDQIRESVADERRRALFVALADLVAEGCVRHTHVVRAGRPVLAFTRVTGCCFPTPAIDDETSEAEIERVDLRLTREISVMGTDIEETTEYLTASPA